MVEVQLKQMKEFFGLFNRISECCFNHCVNSLLERDTTFEEVKCVDRCVTKFLGLNHKIMDVFVEIQPTIVQRRMDEMNKMQNSPVNEEQQKQ